MSTTIPPNPNVDVFNNSYWSVSDIPLTQSKADRRYLRYPVAQGKETLQDVDVNGVANFNQPITMTSATVGNRSISSSTYNVLNASNTNIGAVGYSSNSLYYNSTINSARHIFNATTSLGVNLNIMEMTADNGLSVARPIDMTVGTAANRKITTGTYNILSGAGVLSGNIAVSGSTDVVYTNSINSGVHRFQVRDAGGVTSLPLLMDSTQLTMNKPIVLNNTSLNGVGKIEVSGTDVVIYGNLQNSGTQQFQVKDAGGTVLTPLTINSTQLSVAEPIVMTGGVTVADKRITAGSYQLNTNAGLAVGQYEISGTYVINYGNLQNGGEHRFQTRDGGGTVSSPFTISSSGVRFGDGTVQTTAASVFAVAYVPSGGLVQTITIPTRCYKIDITAIGSGGLHGTSIGPAYGGTGGGGQKVSTTGSIFVTPGQQFFVRFATKADGTYYAGQDGAMVIQSQNALEAGNQTFAIKILGTDTNFSNCLCRVLNANNGGNAADSLTPGGGAAIGGVDPLVSIYATNWSVGRASAGYTGGTTLYGGNPRGSKWKDGDIGCGAVAFTATTPGSAAAIFTFHMVPGF